MKGAIIIIIWSNEFVEKQDLHAVHVNRCWYVFGMRFASVISGIDSMVGYNVNTYPKILNLFGGVSMIK